MVGAVWEQQLQTLLEVALHLRVLQLVSGKLHFQQCVLHVDGLEVAALLRLLSQPVEQQTADCQHPVRAVLGNPEVVADEPDTALEGLLLPNVVEELGWKCLLADNTEEDSEVLLVARLVVLNDGLLQVREEALLGVVAEERLNEEVQRFCKLLLRYSESFPHLFGLFHYLVFLLNQPTEYFSEYNFRNRNGLLLLSAVLLHLGQ